jgi:protein-S-isoprenylcysteine O-methyltransferase Ste14
MESKSAADRLLVLFIIPFGTVAIPASWVLSTLLEFADYSRPTWVALLGAGVMSTGTILFWRTHFELGRSFSGLLQIMNGANLVTTGLYTRVRHPMYAAIAIYALGQLLLIPNWIAGPSNLIVAVFIYLVRVPREEVLLQQAFGDEFEHYKANSGIIFPRLRRFD